MDSAWDVVVVGAGAAGLFAATQAAERGRRTLLIEKNRKPGVKILMSGGTRCNITQATDSRGIILAYGTQGRFLHSALAALSPQAVVEIFHQENVPTKVESTGKIFPQSDKSLHVQQALIRRAERSGVQFQLGTTVLDIQHSNGEFQIRGEQQTWTCLSLILTTGGQSYPGCGTTGDGYQWARKFGHTIVPLRPALVPLTSPAPWVQALSGLTLSDAVLTVIAPDEKRPLATARGSVLLTHFGVSGPVALNISRVVSSHPQPQSLSLECDCLPDRSGLQFANHLMDLARTIGRSTIAVCLSEFLPRRLVDALLELTQVSGTRRMSELSRLERDTVVQTIKRLQIPLSGTLGFEKAEVTAGGISLDEVESRTMQSRKLPGLFLAGEILDLDGPIGGYNFQAAFSTGHLAGTFA